MIYKDRNDFHPYYGSAWDRLNGFGKMLLGTVFVVFMILPPLAVAAQLLFGR